MSKEKVNILIPVYQPVTDPNERRSLDQCMKVLSGHPITIIKPASLDLADILATYPQLQVENFADHYFKNIQGYNQLMLAPEFYARFLQYEYMLIYQLDAYVFRDELLDWCQKGYDYIGAPWIIKPKYTKLYYRIFLAFKGALNKMLNKPYEESLILGKVGNGGFSLRKVARFHDVTIFLKQKIDAYLAKGASKGVYNEDVFWAVEPTDFSYPGYEEALRFAFDRHPQIAIEQAHRQLPFGCHGWNKPAKLPFWDSIIRSGVTSGSI